MTTIEVHDVWKKFRLHHERRQTLKEKILFRGRGKWEDFWALKGINLTIKKGSTVGLIGQNGSGKSTLLKLLTKIIYPNQGTIKINGKVSSLLELGAGFHPDFTGRENIYMNASIFGLSRKDIDLKINEIIQFSELLDFIDSPVRGYSSGMYMRLAFATAINLDPDILLIDEVLAVGDTSFQKKCFEKINDFKNKGVTIVFVSHDHTIVEKICDTVVWLDGGRIKEIGSPQNVIDSYLLFMAEKSHKQKDNEINSKNLLEIEDKLKETLNAESKRWGNKDLEITSVEILDSCNKVKSVFRTGESLSIKLNYKVNKFCTDIVFGLGIFNKEGICCYGTNTDLKAIVIPELKGQGSVNITLDNLNFLEGIYLLDLAIHSKDGYAYDYLSKQYSFAISPKLDEIGIVSIANNWEFK